MRWSMSALSPDSSDPTSDNIGLFSKILQALVRGETHSPSAWSNTDAPNKIHPAENLGHCLRCNHNEWSDDYAYAFLNLKRPHKSSILVRHSPVEWIHSILYQWLSNLIHIWYPQTTDRWSLPCPKLYSSYQYQVCSPRTNSFLTSTTDVNSDVGLKALTWILQ